MIHSSVKHHVLRPDMGVYTESWKYETAKDIKLWTNGLLQALQQRQESSRSLIFNFVFNFLSQTFLLISRI